MRASFRKLLYISAIGSSFAFLNSSCRKTDKKDLKTFQNITTVNQNLIDTFYTNVQYGLHIYKINHSDVLPQKIGIELLNTNNKTSTVYLEKPELERNKEDTLLFNNGTKPYPYSQPIQYAGNSVIFPCNDSDRLSVFETQYLSTKSMIYIFKPANNKTNLTIEWINNDIVEPYNAEKEKQRANETIHAINDKKIIFWKVHI